MKFLIILFLVLFVLLFPFANVKIVGKKRITLNERIMICLVVSITLTLVFGLPILGVYYLIM